VTRALEAVKGQRVVTPEGVRPATLWLEAGRIVAREDYQRRVSGATVIDAEDRVVSPGLVDTHVHVNEPGRADWEGFDTATRAAAAGGITTLVDMPLNAIPATTGVAALESKRQAAVSQCWVDVGFWGGIVPGNAAEIAGLAEAGVCGYKAFLIDSGVAEFPPITLAELAAVAPAIARTGLPLLVHCEDPAVIAAAAPIAGRDPRQYATYLASRPRQAETAAIAGLLEVAAGEPTLRLHIVHLATGAALPALAAARARGGQVTVETCPHYLSFTAEEIPAGATEFKCAPPIRLAAERERLWAALLAGDIDFVASDHSPCPLQLKGLAAGDFLAAWGGIASLQLLLPAVWTEAERRGAGLPQLAGWLTERPAALAGLGARKGRLAPGFDADLVIWDAASSLVVNPARLEHRHPITPYAGRRLFGVIEATILRGDLIYAEGRLLGEPSGSLLRP
jgi:allantoinase